jgi:hypothetical protein
MGKPVVSTNLPPVCEFNEKHQVLITAEGRPESFLRAIEQALSLGEDETQVARRRAVARQGDWAARLDEMSGLIVAGRGGRARRRDAGSRPDPEGEAGKNPAKR